MALDSTKTTLCWPNYMNIAAIDGGSYTTARPIANAKNRIFAKKSRTTDLTLASTQFDVDIPQLKPIQVVAIASHNFSTDGRIRVTVYQDNTKVDLLHDSGFVDVWPALYSTDQLEWEFDNFWEGTVSEEDRANFTPLFTYFLPFVVIGQYVEVEIDDQLNPDGYLEFGRVFVSDAWQPEKNVSYGVQFGYENTTEVDEADDGTEYFDVRIQKRTLTLPLNYLDQSEAFNRVYSMQRSQGISKEVLVAFNLLNQPEFYSARFIARIKDLDPLSHPYFDNFETTLNFLEIV